MKESSLRRRAFNGKGGLFELAVAFNVRALDILEHLNPSRYAGQRIFVVRHALG